MNGYITTPGAPAPEVWGMIEDLGFKIEVDHQPAAEKPPSFVLSPSNRSTYTNKYASQSSLPAALLDAFLSSLQQLLADY